MLNPEMKRHLQSPYVDAAIQFEKTEREERVASEWAKARKQFRRRAKLEGSSSDDKQQELWKIPTTVRFRDRIKSFPKF
jgi:hypothetical protein